ncbi:MBL fold metallo-hydrolase [Comamonas sp. GB3 AK4-5]|uniref:MBL fold metallo-hydrolase n=1 Tax=Comamonas sp. GB3 AK4-5 TaxID=3231487 RepID=UPI00351E4D4A
MNRRHTLAASALIALATVGGFLGTAQAQAQAQEQGSALQLQTFNPGTQSLFPVSASILSGPTEAVLIDAQFQRNDAQALVEQIKQTGKTLKLVYISQADPDYYFGLDVIQSAFPQARVVAAPQTVAAIEKQMQGKQAYWTPILQGNAPKQLLLPTALVADHFTVDGQRVEPKGYGGAHGGHGYLWVPSLKTVLGGVAVSSGIHVWMADAQTPAARANWLQRLDEIAALHPRHVVPGHYVGAVPQGLEALRFTQGYIQNFERRAAAAQNATQLVNGVLHDYPGLGGVSSLELSAKVFKGEMKWPQ